MSTLLRRMMHGAALGAGAVVGLLVAWSLPGWGTTVRAQAKPASAEYHNPHWSPDGTTLVFESTRDGRSAIYTIDAGGTRLRRLTPSETTAGQPRWSHDGKQIVFYSDRDGAMRLYLMNADGSNQRAFTDGTALDYLPDFSPDADWVVFQSRLERPGIAHDVYTVRIDGTGRTRLTDGQNGYTSPKWSPNGQQILLERAVVTKKYYRDLSRDEMGRMKNSTEIVVMDRDGRNLRQLTTNDVEDSAPQWSSTGATIYFMSRRDGSPGVYAMDANGANPRRVADGTSVTNPSVSPDDRHIAYTKEIGGSLGLYVLEIATGKERMLIGANR